MILKRGTLLLILFLVGGCTSKLPLAPFYSDDNKPKNVILIIGDGMGSGQLTGLSILKRNERLISRFPVVGFQKTFAADGLITDSAASGTAMSTGVKTYVGAIGVDGDTTEVSSIIEKTQNEGLATGIVVSSSLVHGTPASFYAHGSTRLDLEKIAAELPVTAPDFVVGGGKYYFTARGDDRDLVEEMEQSGYEVYDFFSNDINRIVPDPGKKFCFFTAEREPLGAQFGRTYLPLAVNKAIKYLQKRSDKGFFLMIEASQVDWACHNRNGDWLYTELQDLRSVLTEVLKFAEKDGKTLVVLTGDHETGGVSINKRSRLGIPQFEFASNDHTGEMVPVLAMGPGSRYFSGTYDNTDIHHKIWKLISGAKQR